MLSDGDLLNSEYLIQAKAVKAVAKLAYHHVIFGTR